MSRAEWLHGTQSHDRGIPLLRLLMSPGHYWGFWVRSDCALSHRTGTYFHYELKLGFGAVERLWEGF